LQGCAGTHADDSFIATFDRAATAALEPGVSDAMREHRALEVLLLLAERGIVLSPLRELDWADRVHRLVSQRPHAAWTVDELARAFHLSPSTLQRRLGAEGTSASRCIREVRLETAMALLQGTDLQVSEIAGRCGYDSHTAGSRLHSASALATRLHTFVPDAIVAGAIVAGACASTLQVCCAARHSD
jgi:AraC-like DNA-binding protein